MKEILKRILIVLWLAAFVGIFYNVFRFGLLDLEMLQISAIFVVSVWILQFILTGVVNPFTLFRTQKN